MNALLRLLPDNTIQTIERIGRRWYWKLNWRDDDLSRFRPQNLPSRLFSAKMPSLITPHSTVLEVGCGNGHELVMLAEAFPDSVFIGIDIQAQAISTARREAHQRGLHNAIFHAGDIVTVLRNLGRIDICCSVGALIYLSESELAKMLALLRGRHCKTLAFCEITSKGPLVKTHIYIHPYAEIFKGQRHTQEFFDFKAWQGDGYQGAMHVVTH